MVRKNSVLPSFWCLIDVQTSTGSNVMASGKMCPVSDGKLKRIQIYVALRA
jgi:hypothetical protein